MEERGRILRAVELNIGGVIFDKLALFVFNRYLKKRGLLNIFSFFVNLVTI